MEKQLTELCTKFAQDNANETNEQTIIQNAYKLADEIQTIAKEHGETVRVISI